MARNRRLTTTADDLPGEEPAAIVAAIDRRGRVIRVVLTLQDSSAQRAGHKRFTSDNRSAPPKRGAFSFGTIH